MTQGKARIPTPKGLGPEPELRSEALLMTRSRMRVRVECTQARTEAEPLVSLQYTASGKRFSFGLARARRWLRGAVPAPVEKAPECPHCGGEL